MFLHQYPHLLYPFGSAPFYNPMQHFPFFKVLNVRTITSPVLSPRPFTLSLSVIFDDQPMSPQKKNNSLFKSAWARGPPQSSSTAPSPHSQSSVPSTPILQCHPRCPTTLGQGIPIQDGISIHRNNAHHPHHPQHLLYTPNLQPHPYPFSNLILIVPAH